MRSLLALWAVAGLLQVAQAAYIIEVDIDGTDDGVLTLNPDFAFGGDTTTASSSATAAVFGGTGGDSIFGGDGVNFPDTYVFTHSPDSQTDNLAITAGQDLGEDNFASGLTGGTPGLYRVYAAWPFTSNVSGGLTSYEVLTEGDSFTTSTDQTGGGLGRGDDWVLLGEIEYTTGRIIVTQTCESNTFVSMRAYGVLFEMVPEPSSLLLLGGAALLAIRRR